MKYELQVIWDNTIVVPDWEVTYGKFATLAFEEVIYNFLPGSFDEWEVFTHEGGNVVYKSKHGKMAFCRLMKWGHVVDDFDEEDKPQRRSMFAVFTGSKQIDCNTPEQVGRAVARAIFDNLNRYHRGGCIRRKN